MKKTPFYLTYCLFLLPFVLFSQTSQKVPLDHSVYDSWKDLRSPIVSDDGKWVSYEINPQQGDGWLYLKNVRTGALDSVSRGYQAHFTPGSDFLVFMIKPQFAVTRQAKKDKKKGDDMPKDSLGIWLLATTDIQKIEKVKSYRVAKENSSWIVYHLEKIVPDEPEKEKAEKEELTEEEKEKARKKKEELGKLKKAKGTDLVILNPVSTIKYEYPNITDYTFSQEGDLISFTEVTGDSIDYSRVFNFNTSSEEANVIWEKEGEVKQLVNDREGEQVAFLHSEDTIKAKVFSLYGWSSRESSAALLADTVTPGIPEGWSPSEHSNLYFSEDGSKFFFGTAPKPEPEKEDTLLDEEKYKVDIWNWKDPYLQPMQLVNADREKKRTYDAVIHLKNKQVVQLADEEMPDLRTILKGNGNVALGSSDLPYRQLISWDANRYRDIYRVDLTTGNRKLLIKKAPSTVSLSPNGKYLIWWETEDSSWYARSMITDQVVSLTKKIPVNFYDELHDEPCDPRPYRSVNWIGKDDYVLISDRYDFWKIDPSGKEKPVNLTNGFGRKNNIRFSYERLDPDEETIDPKGTMLLRAFHEFNKQSGFYNLTAARAADPVKIMMDDYYFTVYTKARNEDLLMFTKQDFQTYPDLWIADLNFTSPVRISNTNPQQENYLWGTTELVEWISFDQEKLQGILHKPENFDPDKKYPMIVYFYERSSDGIHRHSTPRPLRSSMNWTYYVSNGYLVFVPDIPYTIGYPGESAYNAVVSGTMALIDRFDYVDKDHIGLNGHSWGGYQIAYLVTRTNLFACAHSGAPVSNMTSAYGGIRWSSGMSRMFQYEQTQSRIGGTLWEKPVHYIQNSPIFFVPKIETPVLMLHNDEDGAVPWYQGIEFFVALRRLGKPAWLLNYNGENHGLGKRPNQVDFTIRVSQYYNHFLKGEPAPEWMVKGIPATEKGKNDGYQLMHE